MDGLEILPPRMPHSGARTDSTSREGTKDAKSLSPVETEFGLLLWVVRAAERSTQMNVFVFPGQGSQKRGMGQDLFNEVPEFLSAEQEIDALLGYSVRKLCLEDGDKQLSQTQYTQPCLYVVNALHYYKAVADGARPEYLAGHSLGEYNALMAAGAFDFMTGLRLVQRRGELMAGAKNGAMAAVIGLSSEAV